MNNRGKVEQAISRNPGISFTELKDLTGLSNGVLQYHIRSSPNVRRQKGSIIEKGFCSECKFNEFCSSKCIYGVFRDEKNSIIIRKHLNGKKNIEIAEELGIDPSTASYHVNKLRDLGLIS